MGAATITTTMSDYVSIQPSKIILEMLFFTMHDAVDGFIAKYEPCLLNRLAHCFTSGAVPKKGMEFLAKPAEYVKINCPVLLQWGKEDNRVPKQETDEIFANLASSNKTLVEYDGVGHASLCKNAPQQWTKSVTVF